MTSDQPDREKRGSTRAASLRLVYLAAVFAAVGGLLSGYDTGVISGALPFIKNSFTLSTFQQGLVVSIVLVGAAIAAIGGGSFSDRIGRRKSLILTSAVFITGALVSATAPSMPVLIAGRVVIGLESALRVLLFPCTSRKSRQRTRADGWYPCTNWP